MKLTLFEEAVIRLNSIKEQQKALNIIKMSDNFPLLGSFAEDDQEQHCKNSCVKK